MSDPRLTQCLTWGEERRHGERRAQPNGTVVCIDFAQTKTLCGALMSEYVESAGGYVDADKRPTLRVYRDALGRDRRIKGVCRKCWKQLRIDVAAMEAECLSVAPKEKKA